MVVDMIYNSIFTEQHLHLFSFSVYIFAEVPVFSSSSESPRPDLSFSYVVWNVLQPGSG